MIFPIRGKEREDGIAGLSLLVMGMVLSLTIVLYLALPLATASDSKSANRTAADAAALAGAEFVRTDLESLLSSEGWLGSWNDYTPLLDFGGAAASMYADRNGSKLIAYDFDPIGWKATAKVEGDQIREGTEKPVSEATAQLDFPDCLSKPDEDDDDDDDDDPDAPPKIELHCDGLNISVVPVKDGDDYTYDLPGWAISQLLDLTTVKLVD